jgi:hypothetical protein
MTAGAVQLILTNPVSAGIAPRAGEESALTDPQGPTDVSRFCRATRRFPSPTAVRAPAGSSSGGRAVTRPLADPSQRGRGTEDERPALRRLYGAQGITGRPRPFRGEGCGDEKLVQHFIPTLTLPDVDDRHVLAATIHGGAGLIIRFSLSDYPA